MRIATVGFSLLTTIFFLNSCKPKNKPSTQDAHITVGGLTPEQAQKPIVRIGNHVITLGDFAQELAELPEFERMRYQSIERRKELLRSMIDMYLLAEEAKKQGLDKDPLVAEETRQILVAYLRGQLRNELPSPSEIPEAEVRAYYKSHLDEFRDPERRRVALITTVDENTIKKAYEETKTVPQFDWGTLVKKYSNEPVKETEASEMAGDIGFVTASFDTKEIPNAKATPEVRAEVFKLVKAGELSHPFRDARGWHILKMLAKNEAREQTYQDVERILRIRIVQEQLQSKEKALLEEMKKKHMVTINETALEAAATEITKEATSPSVSSSSSLQH